MGYTIQTSATTIKEQQHCILWQAHEPRRSSAATVLGSAGLKLTSGSNGECWLKNVRDGPATKRCPSWHNSLAGHSWI